MDTATHSSVAGCWDTMMTKADVVHGLIYSLMWEEGICEITTPTNLKWNSMLTEPVRDGDFVSPDYADENELPGGGDNWVEISRMSGSGTRQKGRWAFQVEGAVPVDVQMEENEGSPGWVSPWWAGPGERAGTLEKLREGGEGGADHANQDPF